MEKSLEQRLEEKFEEYWNRYRVFIYSDLKTIRCTDFDNKNEMRFSIIMKPHELVMEDIENNRLRNTNPTDK